jgi:hypothetical protein
MKITFLRNRQLLGSGNVNNFFVGGAYYYNQHLSFGFNIEYNFGVINNTSKQTCLILNTKQLSN